MYISYSSRTPRHMIHSDRLNQRHTDTVWRSSMTITNVRLWSSMMTQLAILWLTGRRAASYKFTTVQDVITVITASVRVLYMYHVVVSNENTLPHESYMHQIGISYLFIGNWAKLKSLLTVNVKSELPSEHARNARKSVYLLQNL